MSLFSAPESVALWQATLVLSPGRYNIIRLYVIFFFFFSSVILPGEGGGEIFVLFGSVKTGSKIKERYSSAL